MECSDRSETSAWPKKFDLTPAAASASCSDYGILCMPNNSANMCTIGGTIRRIRRLNIVVAGAAAAPAAADATASCCRAVHAPGMTAAGGSHIRGTLTCRICTSQAARNANTHRIKMREHIKRRRACLSLSLALLSTSTCGLRRCGVALSMSSFTSSPPPPPPPSHFGSAHKISAVF